MPTYEYRCAECGPLEFIHSMSETLAACDLGHPMKREIRSLPRIAPSVMPTRSLKPGQEHVLETLARDKRWDRDMPAFKRLAEQGVCPPKIDGSAELESRATCREHVETGHPEWPESSIRRVEDLFGHKITEPQTTPKTVKL